MDPPRRVRAAAASRLPRTRGDGPVFGSLARAFEGASPHTRGWTLGVALETLGNRGFPAHAGMDRARSASRPATRRLPRTRGDGPAHVRRAARPAGASPHTRGWTHGGSGPDARGSGFPAHAGMDLIQLVDHSARARLPRTRGDGPWTIGGRRWRLTASPHTRGWTPSIVVTTWPPTGFPAHAGMDPCRCCRPRTRPRLPRTRGDGPFHVAIPTVFLWASPHTRGWTLRQYLVALADDGFPAHAGMDPRNGAGARNRPGLPRTRGDGPVVGIEAGPLPMASPHTRGWTRPRAGTRP